MIRSSDRVSSYVGSEAADLAIVTVSPMWQSKTGSSASVCTYTLKM